MGRPFGVPVYVAPSWFLVAALITWVFGGQLDRVLPELGAARYLVSLFFAVAFYASVLVHELAHTVAALRFKLPVRRIQLQFFGGVSEIEKEAETPGREFVLAFVGPLLSLVLSGVFYAALLPVQADSVPGVLLVRPWSPTSSSPPSTCCPASPSTAAACSAPSSGRSPASP
ncbi:Putative zinc metalloprotease Rip3 [Streptomyces tendae]